MEEKQKEVKQFVANRQRAYGLVFKKEDQMAQQVLSDLAKFCRANRSTFRPDSREHAVLEGRREVWLRIQNHINMDPEMFWQLITREGA